MPLLEPKHGTVDGYPEFGEGWRLRSPQPPRVLILIRSKRDLRFASRGDCERAIKSFEDEGIQTFEELAAMDDERRAMLATRYLSW